MNPLRLGVEQLPDPGRGRVTEYRSGAGVEECRLEPGFERECRVTHGVDARMHPLKPPRRNPSGDGAARKPERIELRAADHAVLPRRKCRNPFCFPFVPLSGSNSTQKCHASIVGAEMARNAGVRAV